MFTTCTHTLESGETCQSPAVRNTTLCFHHTPREIIRRSPRRSSASFELPALDSRNSILVATNEVIQRLAEGSIKRSEAETMLKALKMATHMMTALEDESSEPEAFFEPDEPLLDHNTPETASTHSPRNQTSHSDLHGSIRT